jgi:hypothetical protein
MIQPTAFYAYLSHAELGISNHHMPCPNIDLVPWISMYNYSSGHGHLISAIMVRNKNYSFHNVIFHNFEMTNCCTGMAPHSDIICKTIYTSHRDGEHTRKLAVSRIHICYYGVKNQHVMVGTVIIHANPGDKVYIRTRPDYSSIDGNVYSDTSERTSFAGWLITGSE